MKLGWALSALLFGCGGPSLRGARVLEPEQTLAWAQHARAFAPDGCVDAAGTPAPSPAVVVGRARASDGAEVALEWRAGYLAVLISNSVSTPEAVSFEYASDDGRGGRVLHVLSFPSQSPLGRLALVQSFSVRQEPHGFRAADVGPPALSCSLVPLDLPVTQEPAATRRPPAGSH